MQSWQKSTVFACLEKKWQATKLDTEFQPSFKKFSMEQAIRKTAAMREKYQPMMRKYQ